MTCSACPSITVIVAWRRSKRQAGARDRPGCAPARPAAPRARARAGRSPAGARDAPGRRASRPSAAPSIRLAASARRWAVSHSTRSNWITCVVSCSATQRRKSVAVGFEADARAASRFARHEQQPRRAPGPEQSDVVLARAPASRHSRPRARPRPRSPRRPRAGASPPSGPGRSRSAAIRPSIGRTALGQGGERVSRPGAAVDELRGRRVGDRPEPRVVGRGLDRLRARGLDLGRAIGRPAPPSRSARPGSPAISVEACARRAPQSTTVVSVTPARRRLALNLEQRAEHLLVQRRGDVEPRVEVEMGARRARRRGTPRSPRPRARSAARRRRRPSGWAAR